MKRHWVLSAVVVAMLGNIGVVCPEERVTEQPDLGRSPSRLSWAAHTRLQWACLAHLSEKNNTPKLALETHRKVLGDRLPLWIATGYQATDVLGLWFLRRHGFRPFDFSKHGGNL